MCSLWEASQTVVTLHTSIARAIRMLVSFQVYSPIAVRRLSLRRRNVSGKFGSTKFIKKNLIFIVNFVFRNELFMQMPGKAVVFTV